MFGRTRTHALAGLVALALPAGALASLPYGAAWKLTSADTGHEIQSFHDVAVGPDGNLVAIGNVVGNGTPTPYIVKISPTGTVLWAKATGFTDFAFAVTVGADGKIYVGGGGMSGGGTTTVFIGAYDANGGQLWT